MTKKKSRSNRIGFIFVITLGGVMAMFIGFTYLSDENKLTTAELIAKNLHIENTTCSNVQLALQNNENSARSTIVRDELNRVLREGNC